METIYLFLGGSKKAMQKRADFLLHLYSKDPGEIIITGLKHEIIFYVEILKNGLSLANYDKLILKYSWDSYSNIEQLFLPDKNSCIVIAVGEIHGKRFEKILDCLGKHNFIVCDSHEEESWNFKILYWLYSTPIRMKIMSRIAKTLRFVYRDEKFIRHVYNIPRLFDKEYEQSVWESVDLTNPKIMSMAFKSTEYLIKD